MPVIIAGVVIVGEFARPVDVYAAVSADGGRTWTDHRVTSRRSNMNYEVDFGLTPFFGDYISVSAIPGIAFAVWTDTRDLPAMPPQSFRQWWASRKPRGSA